MKKFILSLGVAALTMGALTSCGDKSSSASPEDKAFADTLATTLGEFAGAQQQQMWANMKGRLSEAELAKYNKADFLKGLSDVLNADTTKMAYFQGIQVGLQLLQPIMGVSQNYDFPVSTRKVYESFKKVFEMDSLPQVNDYQQAYQEAFMTLQTKAQQKETQRLEESKENKENLEKGAAYVDDVVKNQGYTRAESGIAYKIENPGTGDKVKPTDKVSIFYKGKKIDGNVFDETKEDPYTASASAFIPGFNEALTMLAKGGKMTVVIPGDQAYGINGAGDLIGPNETLVFDIEIADINPAPTTPAR